VFFGGRHDQMMKIVGGSLLVIAIIVLAYGYWFGKNHGSLYVMVMDVSDREHPKERSSASRSPLTGDHAPDNPAKCLNGNGS